MEKISIASKRKKITKKQASPERIPWLAFGSLLVVLLCLGASVAVILLSDFQTVESWAVQPAVQLAILAALSNVALGIAFSEAVVVTWWASAANGASLDELHYIWNRGEGLSFFSALAAGPAAGKVARTMLALIIIKVATGPLLQRSTRQLIAEIVSGETNQLNVAQRLPPGWMGVVTNTSSIVGSTKSVEATIAWWHNASINTPDSYCDGTCEGNVPGAGISYNCTSTVQSLNLLAGIGPVLFAVNTTMSRNSAGIPFLLLTTLYSSAIGDDCTANLTIDTCKIEAGIIDYPVILQNSTIMLDSNKLNDYAVRSTYTDSGDLPTAKAGSPAGPLRGLNHFADTFYTRAWLSGPSTYNGNLMAKMFIQTNSSAYDDFTYTQCALKWFSPTHFVLNSLHDFMFRAALRAANSTESQAFNVSRRKNALVFYTIYPYLAAASIITLLGVLLVLIRLQGRWSLGRTVSLSPIETAKAFSAPIMERARYSNVTADAILKDIGQIQVTYVDGVMVDDGDSKSSTVEPLLTQTYP